MIIAEVLLKLSLLVGLPAAGKKENFCDLTCQLLPLIVHQSYLVRGLKRGGLAFPFLDGWKDSVFKKRSIKYLHQLLLMVSWVLCA